jgi:hypothetical protein
LGPAQFRHILYWEKVSVDKRPDTCLRYAYNDKAYDKQCFS